MASSFLSDFIFNTHQSLQLRNSSLVSIWRCYPLGRCKKWAVFIFSKNKRDLNRTKAWKIIRLNLGHKVQWQKFVFRGINLFAGLFFSFLLSTRISPLSLRLNKPPSKRVTPPIKKVLTASQRYSVIKRVHISFKWDTLILQLDPSFSAVLYLTFWKGPTAFCLSCSTHSIVELDKNVKNF